MSYLTDTDVNKRARNLFVSLEQPAPSGPIAIFEVSADNAIQFLAQYTADFPTLVPNNATGEWSQTGVNGSISPDLLQASMTAACGALPNVSGYPLGALPRCMEITCVQTPSDVGSPLNTAIAAPLLIPNPPNLNLYVAGQAPGVCAYYQSDGQIIGALSILAAPYAGGDVIGMVLSDVIPGVAYATTWYLNGVNQGTVNVNDGGGTYATLAYIG